VGKVQEKEMNPVNRNKVDQWKADVSKSVDMYNEWFLNFAPRAFRATRIETTKSVEKTLESTRNLTDVSPDLLCAHPQVLPTLRMATCPPIAVDRLIGLAGVSPSLVRTMEKKGSIPPRMEKGALSADLEKIGTIIEKLADPDIFVWLGREAPATLDEVHRAATIVADRLCGAVANPIIRNEQEKRQLGKIKEWLEKRGYTQLESTVGTSFDELEAGKFSFRYNVRTRPDPNAERTVNIPVDAVIMPLTAKKGDLPLLVEAKSAGDFTNTNKRRKEEANKVANLRATYGEENVKFILFLCGYFDSGYLGYEAAEGIDWVWEHRIDDLAEFGL
jgi:XamI-like restriction endonuclease